MPSHSARPFSALAARTFARATRLAGLSLTFRPDELYRVPTDDGAAIALGRYHPIGERRFVEPVILCHGLGVNRFSLDLDERHSLARYLARRGFETWVLELRGRGLAGKPHEQTTFDDQAEFDVRAALRTVRSSGAEAVTWVGHSKGGLLLFAHMARWPDAPVRALVTLGSGGSFTVQHSLKRLVRTLSPLTRRKVVPLSRLALFTTLGLIHRPVTRYLFLEDNIEPEILRRAIACSLCDIAGGVARQLVRWMEENAFTSNSGFDYYANMANIRIPALVIAGSQDRIAPPHAVARAAEALGGPVEMVIAGRADGLTAEYGHCDLTIGRRAPDEIFPRVEAFLARHSTPHGRGP